jgi:hypothetical protein
MKAERSDRAYATDYETRGIYRRREGVFVGATMKLVCCKKGLSRQGAKHCRPAHERDERVGRQDAASDRGHPKGVIASSQAHLTKADPEQAQDDEGKQAHHWDTDDS